MSKIISFGNQKGGVGKSTVTLLCANALSSNPFDHSVFVVDADKQRSLIRRRTSDLQGFDGSTPYPIQQMTFADFANERNGIYKLVQDYEYIFLDTAGKLDENLPVEQQEITKYLQYVDYLFIPFTPGNFSLESTTDYLRIALKTKAQRQKKGRPMKVIGFVNMYENRTLDDKFLMEEIDELKAYVNIQFMEHNLNRYALFRATDTLTTFYESNSNDKPTSNFSTWFDEFKNTVDNG